MSRLAKEEQKKYKINLMNRILKDLLELQLIYFDDDNKFNIITDIIFKYSFFVEEEVTNNVKIKDNVDLKELEKYGFIKTQPYAYTDYWHYIIDVNGVSEITIDNGREIIIKTDESTILDLDVLYDLIQAGLVEKVGN